MQEKRRSFLDWNIYQVYPRSFLDTNGDGVGDLDGITEKLEYLCALGINAIWISPCYKSPNFDNGYDVADYLDIATEYGGMQAWKRLRTENRRLGIKLIMDLVVNHTSYEHIWFQEARKSKDNPYHDYYIWAEQPKNAWQSVFGGSAWEYNPTTNEYYLHSFAVEQPDLNWENPKVRAECCKVVDFWVDMGVDGFRCDVLDFIAKDFKRGKMYAGERLHEYIRQLFGREKTSGIFTLGECNADEKSIVDICGEDRDELTAVLQFEHINLGKTTRFEKVDCSYDDVRNVLVKWQRFAIKNNLLYMLFTDNHDQPFYISRLGDDKAFRYECATMYAAMFYLLYGIPLVYQGQEFGSANAWFENVGAFNDVETIRYYSDKKSEYDLKTLWEKINFGNRDNSRRPMAWTESERDNHGFSQGNPWLLQSLRAREINLQTDVQSNRSIFGFYKKILDYRNQKRAIRYGSFEDLTKGNGYFAYKRSYKTEEVIVVCNFDKERNICVPVNDKEYDFIFGNYNSIEPFKEIFHPFEVRVYEKRGK